MTHSVDVLVIGAGQAGLAAGYWLRQTNLTYEIVDGALRIGDSWRRRWDSLRLFTPAGYSSLPGLAITGDPWGYPSKDHVAAYLETYADHFALPVRLGDPVMRLERRGVLFQARLSSGRSLTSRAVIAATGPFQAPLIPPFADTLSAQVAQLDPGTYRSPRSVANGVALVVGDGATGRQIALELAATHRVLLATGRPRRVIPSRLLGRSIFWWLDRLGVLHAPHTSRTARWLRATDAFPGRRLSLRALGASGVELRPRLITVHDDHAEFGDGRIERIDTVVWAIGYRDDTRWLAIDGALDGLGRVAHRDGTSPVPGLYHVGRSWQRTRASALLAGVGDDARRVVGRLLIQLVEGTPPAPQQADVNTVNRYDTTRKGAIA